MRSAKRPHRPEAEFFADPHDTAQRRYEALRAYFLEGATAAQAAARFGYAESSVQAMVRDFRAGDRDFFAPRRPGPRIAPAKQAARAEVLRLRAAGHSITEIEQALAPTATPLNRTGIWELLRDEGFERLPTRPTDQRGGPRRDHPPRTRRIAWPPQPLRLPCDFAGILLLVPGLVALDLPTAVTAAHLPGTREVPALCSVLSLLALKATGRRRVSHIDDVATDPALATFAGLESLPKATALGTYSYRLARHHDQALLAALGPAMIRTGQAAGTDFDLDFHAIMHYGEDVALETHYVPRRSQRTESVLTFFAQDGQTHNLVYANADLHKTTQAGEVMAFARHWQAATGTLPELLVFDAKVTTGAGLAELDRAGIRFLTLRARSPKLLAALDTLPASAWTRVTLDRTGPYRHPHVHENRVTVRGCPVALRQLAVRGLGHDQPTLILTNNHQAKPAKLIDRYAKRMTIEQRLAEQIRSFHLDALSSAVALNVDLDTTLTVWAQAAYDALRRRLPGYATATPDTIWRRFISTKGHLTLGPTEVVARIAERTYSPVLRSADLPEVQVPWWGGRRLRFEIAVGKTK
jgi:transposase